jgi:hypothetical protein
MMHSRVDKLIKSRFRNCNFNGKNLIELLATSEKRSTGSTFAPRFPEASSLRFQIAILSESIE